MGGPAPIAPSEILRAEHHARLVALLDCEILREQRDDLASRLSNLRKFAGRVGDDLEELVFDFKVADMNATPNSERI